MRNHEEPGGLAAGPRAYFRDLSCHGSFPRSETFGLRSQIRRAASSIGANLAEGCGRWSDAELARYVQIAMGSASEVQNHLRLAMDLGFLERAEYTKLLNNLTSIRQVLTAFLQRLRGVRPDTRNCVGVSGE